MTTPSNGRRTTSRRTTPKQTKVSIDLDKLDAEGRFKDVGPFTFRHGGKVFTLDDPDDLDVFDLLDAGDGPAGMAVVFSKLLGDQFEEFRALGRAPVRKINAVMEAFQQHYGLPDPGEAPASVTSSNGTGAR